MKKSEIITMSTVGAALLLVLVLAITAIARSLRPGQSPEVSLPEVSRQAAAPSSREEPSRPVFSEPERIPSAPAPSQAPASSEELVSSEDTVPEESLPESEEAVPPESSEEQESSENEVILDGAPQPNPVYAHTPNRALPVFTVDTSLEGPDGEHHGEWDGQAYYHVGLDAWINDEMWYAYRFGAHPEATDTDWNTARRSRVSPFQIDGDYDPYYEGGCYYCALCGEWVPAQAWEDGSHGDKNPNHLAG